MYRPEMEEKMSKMFDVGDFIIYGTNGVCKVSSVGKLSISNDDKLYYTLVPIYSKASTVYTPVDNEKVVMRRLISKEEAKELVENINSVETIPVDDEKKREECYKHALRTCECTEWVKLIRTSYLRIQDRRNNGKKVINSDEKYLKAAEDYLYGELAIALDMDKDKVRDYIVEKVTEKH